MLIMIIVAIFVTVKLIKRRIDLYSRSQEYMQSEAESAQDKVKAEQENERKEAETTIHTFDKGVIQAASLGDEDTCIDRLLKKIMEFNLSFHPLMLSLPLAFVTGRTQAALLILFNLALFSCFLFNSFKIHRACMDHVLPRWFF